MRQVNLVVLFVIICGTLMTGSCLYTHYKHHFDLIPKMCVALGPGIVLLSLGSAAALFLFIIGVIRQLQDRRFNVFKSLYAVNLGLGCCLMFFLLVDI